jgi:4-amino-4-deoxy-L-arabinose transferase-like glycosyltransferase
MRPLTPAAARALLGALLVAFAALAVNASLLLPLWEPADEHEHWLVVEHWARTHSMPDLRDMPLLALNEGVQPPLAYWMFAGGAHALGIAGTDFLARRATFSGTPVIPGASRFLHGADERFPFAGPVRRLHLLRLLNVLCGLAAVCGAYALGRRLCPAGFGLALGAAGLVALQPAFVALCGGISNDPLAVALGTWALVALAWLLREPAPTLRAGLAAGALIGAAHLAKLSATFLLPLVPLALLLRRRRGEGWRPNLRLLDGLVAGFAIVTGPFFAWNLAHYGDPFGWSVIEGKFGGERAMSAADAVLLHFVPDVAASWVAQLSGTFRAGLVPQVAWGALVALSVLLAALPAVRRRARAAGVDGRVALLCGAALVVNVAAALKFFLDFNQPQGRYLHPTLPAAACLVAAAWCWLPRPAGVAGLAALALLCFRTQVHELGPAYAPLARERDPHFMSFDPLARVGTERRLPVLALLAPEDGSRHVDPPVIRWELPDDPERRFSVHLRTPGLSARVRTWEDFGISARDRYSVPLAEIWSRLPPDVPMVVQVIELPTLAEALAARDGALDVRQSAEVTVRREEPPASH